MDNGNKTHEISETQAQVLSSLGLAHLFTKKTITRYYLTVEGAAAAIKPRKQRNSNRVGRKICSPNAMLAMKNRDYFRQIIRDNPGSAQIHFMATHALHYFETHGPVVRRSALTEHLFECLLAEDGRYGKLKSVSPRVSRWITDHALVVAAP